MPIAWFLIVFAIGLPVFAKKGASNNQPLRYWPRHTPSVKQV